MGRKSQFGADGSVVYWSYEVIPCSQRDMDELLVIAFSWIMDRTIPAFRRAWGNRGCFVASVVAVVVLVWLVAPSFLERQGEDWRALLICPIENPRTFFMHGFTEQKGSVQAEIAVGDRTFQVIVTHLASHEKDPPRNYPQQVEILSVVEGEENVLLIGDFNFGPDTEQYELTTGMLDDSWVLRWPGVDKRTVDFKGEGIDHIFVSPGTRVTDAQYLPERESDHPAVTAVIEW